MNSKIIFIYDGECPFCNHFAELIELKSGIEGIKIKNARDNPSEVPENYDMNINGAILLVNGETFFGASAINYICNRIKLPSGTLLRVLKTVFKSRQRSRLLFPLLLISRRLALLYKGVPLKLTFSR